MNKERVVILLFVGCFTVGIGVFLFLGLKQSYLARNEREASAALKTLATAEADFRANDRDGNGVNDFWTGDVAGLYSIRSNAALDSPEIMLISREIAEADAAPIKPLVPKPIPYHGYLFRALEENEESGDGEFRFYKMDTGGQPRMGKVHNPSSFGFIAFPAEYPRTGRVHFIINEGNTVFKRPGDGNAVTKWPKDEDLMGGTLTRYDSAPPTPMRKVQDAVAELPRTTVTAHLAEKHIPGKNLIWCATVQIAWDQLGALLKQPLHLEGTPPMALGLNRSLVKEEDLPPGKYYARAGFFKDGIVQTIRREMADRFLNATMPSLPSPGRDSDALAFAYLFTDLPFEAPLLRHTGIKFKGTKVAAFGLWAGHGKDPTSDQIKQVIVRDFQSDRDFVVELTPKGGGERMIVARVSPGATLLETVTSVMARLEGPRGEFHGADDLMIPCVNFELLRSYSEVTGPAHLIKGTGYWIEDAQQMIRFRFDEKGALLESYSYVYAIMNGDPPKGRKMICDGPFLILMAREAGRMPYFAFWVDNDELLIH